MPANNKSRRDSSPDLKRNASMTSSRSKNSSHSGHSHAPGSPKTTPSSRRGRERSRSRARTSSRSPSRDRGGGGNNRERSKSRARSKSRSRTGGSGGGVKIEKYDTPFDPKGRCHYHSGVQLAKKKLTGGWKLLLTTCPKCIEDAYNKNNSDDRSVCSRKSTRSSRSVGGGGRKQSSSSRNKPKYECPFDNQGYCHFHSNFRLAKKKLTGGWKILEEFCQECIEEEREANDNKSVCSRSSRRSTRSRSRAPTPKNIEYDNDSDHDTAASSQREKKRKSVKRMEYSDDNGDEGVYTGYVNSDYKPHGSGKMVYNSGKKFSGEWCEGSKVHGKSSHDNKSTKKSSSSGSQKKEHRRESREHKMKESPKVSHTKNGIHSNGASNNTPTTPTNGASSVIDKQKEELLAMLEEQKNVQKQAALREYKALYNTRAPVVKNMIFVDFYGDRGRYTGEVNDDKMPHGPGEIQYDHGLVQEGQWTNGVLDEDGSSIVSSPKGSQRGRESKSSSSRGTRAKSKDP